ncbi:MAG: DUF4238 domain-containing protein [Pyrinomonadaceae bacterium]
MANDHYVPQFYLRSFTIPARTGWIVSYGRNSQPRERAIRSVASIDDYYTMRSNITGVQKDQVDQLFRNVESGAAPVLNHLLAAPNTRLHPNDKEILSMFIAFLAFRTPRARANVMRMDSEVRIQILRILAGHKEFFHQEAERAGIDPEEAEAARQAVFEMGDDLRVEYQPGETEDYFMRTQLEMADRVSDIINRKFWYLLECTGGFFITSDHPVVLARPENYPAYLGVGFEPATIFLTISPKRCLLMTNRPILGLRFPGCLMLPLNRFRTNNGTLIKVDEAKVEAINKLVMSQAYEAVFSHTRSAGVEQAFNQTGT